MITILNTYSYVYDVLINFIAHFIIFIGTFYVALQNRNLPQWHITPLWYVGLFSFLVCISILLQWGIGPEFPLSYFNLGKLAETLVDISVASIAGIMLIATIRKDLRGRKSRRTKSE